MAYYDNYLFLISNLTEDVDLVILCVLCLTEDCYHCIPSVSPRTAMVWRLTEFQTLM